MLFMSIPVVKKIVSDVTIKIVKCTIVEKIVKVIIDRMAGNNPRKFKDRIALLNQKQAESTAQFQAVMRDVSEVKKPIGGPGQQGYDIGGGRGHILQGGDGGLAIPRHLTPGLPNHHPHFRYGGSLPNVNQMATASAGNQDMQNNLQGVSHLQPNGGGCNTDQSGQFLLNQGVPGDGLSGVGGYPNQTILTDRSRGHHEVGGGAIRNRSGERRWENSPYDPRGGGSYYSSSLSTYLSPPPESRWRRTASDSALYQKLNQSKGGNRDQEQQGGGSEQGSPVQEHLFNGGGESDIKPPPELLSSLLLKEGEPLPDVKEEPTVNGGHHLTELPPAPAYPTQPPQSPSSPSSPLYHSGSSSPQYHSTVQQQYRPPANLEQEFQRFRLDCPAYQDTGGGGLNINNPETPTTCPTSPHTPSALPDIYIQDYSQDWHGGTDNDKGLDAEFVDTLREGLEPIDDQLLATLTGATFVDPAVEEQFKMNY